MYRPNAIPSVLNPLGFGDFDRYLESFFGDSVLSPATKVCNCLPAVDVRETDKAYVLDMELPGFDEKDIEINVDGSSLSIASKQETAADSESDKGTWIIRERRLNSFSRSFKLPENANPETVTAGFKNGMLNLEIGKKEEAQKRTIPINNTQ